MQAELRAYTLEKKRIKELEKEFTIKSFKGLIIAQKAIKYYARTTSQNP